MALRQHRYEVSLSWTGNRGAGTETYTAYDRSYQVEAHGKPALLGSADPGFRGDPGRWTPEELLVASLSACHQLWYLHLCAEADVVVLAYEDHAVGLMVEEPNGAGQFTAVTLRPLVAISQASDRQKAMRLHGAAHAMCFIARSMNFPVGHEPIIQGEGDAGRALCRRPAGA